ncbi:hypothetical protein [Streptomyces roseoverticillatus]|uniref:hypothetical protein n=1 Tax=Streptomyces roseoverticillatus TaxID=66429 RepID=UPI0012FEF65C|nr:hypothetical protein [Streptomyces roseoverticillatus]
MNHDEPLAGIPLVAYRSAPPGVHIAQSQGKTCTLTVSELIIPDATHEVVPLSAIGAVHHEHDSVIVIDAVNYHFALECQSREDRDQFAFCVAYAARCNLYDADGLADMGKLEKRYLG